MSVSESTIKLVRVMVFNLGSKIDGFHRDHMDAYNENDEAGMAAASRDIKDITAQVNALVELTRRKGGTVMLKTFGHGPFTIRARCGKGIMYAVCRIDGSKVTVIQFRMWQSDAEIDVREFEAADKDGTTYMALKADR